MMANDGTIGILKVRLSLLFVLGKAVTVNGMPVNLPKSYSGSGLTLERAGMFVTLSSRLGVSLLWDGGIKKQTKKAHNH